MSAEAKRPTPPETGNPVPAHKTQHRIDQPIVLNRRQAGPAIEGALRQQQVDRIERVAVDTHGFTHFAMALAKLVGFDLCPRLAKLKKRKLYLSRDLDIPEILRPCVAETVSRRAIARGWEGLLRLAASVKHGCIRRPRPSTASVRPLPAIPYSKPATRSGGFCALFISATSSPIRYSGSKSSICSTKARRSTACSAPSTTASSPPNTGAR
jgi:hypothetical protein